MKKLYSEHKHLLILCGIGILWVIVFVGMLLGMRFHPRTLQLITVILVGWFAYWTIVSIFGNTSTPTQIEKPVDNSEKKDDTK